LEELLRMRLIEMAEVLFDLPELKAAIPAQPAAQPAQAGIDSVGVGEFDFDAMAANVEQWLKQDTESFTGMRKADLNKTIQKAAMHSTQAFETLHDSGFFTNLMEPLPIAGKPAPAKRPAPAAPQSLAKKRLALVFESDPADTAALSRLLNDGGYQAQLCASRQQLVLLLNQPVSPEVIFLKLAAKDVDVFKVLEKLRMHPRLGKVAVVMMADQPSREDIAKSILLGASGWIIKPYTADAVTAAIKGALSFPTSA